MLGSCSRQRFPRPTLEGRVKVRKEEGVRGFVWVGVFIWLFVGVAADAGWRAHRPASVALVRRYPIARHRHAPPPPGCPRPGWPEAPPGRCPVSPAVPRSRCILLPGSRFHFVTFSFALFHRGFPFCSQAKLADKERGKKTSTPSLIGLSGQSLIRETN